MPGPVRGRRFVEALAARLADPRPLAASEQRALVAAADGVSLTEADAVRAISVYGLARDRFAVVERRHLDALFEGMPIRANANRPAPPRPADEQPEHAAQVFLERDARWSRVSGTLFVEGAGPDDPIQGAVEDCAFIAAFIAEARADPAHIERILRRRDDGTLVATFWGRRNEGGALEPLDVALDDALPTIDGALVYAHGRDRAELWPALLEKAYAKWKGDYLFCFDADQSLPGDAVAAVTGREPVIALVTPSTDPAALYERLARALDARGCIVAGTRSGDARIPRDGLESGHAYAVMSVSTSKSGARRVTLRNPRGATTTIPLRRFVRHFDLVAIA